MLGQRLTSISTRKVPYFRRSLGVVFQDFRLLPNKTVFDNVAFTLQVIGKSRGFIQAAVPDVLEMVGLAEKSSNFPHELSGGEQQRVAIARAVVNKPSIVLADEPTGNLDPRTSEGIMAVLERINQQGHDGRDGHPRRRRSSTEMQKRVVELVQGRIIRDEHEATYVTSSIKLPKLAGRRDAGRSATAPARSGPAAGSDAAPATGAQPAQAPRPATAVRSPCSVPPPGRSPSQRPATGAQPVVSARRPTARRGPADGRPPIWVRAETGPVLLPGEHAPWRAAPVAPPAEEEHPDGRSLFFAAPVPAQRTETGAVPIGADRSRASCGTGPRDRPHGSAAHRFATRRNGRRAGRTASGVGIARCRTISTSSRDSACGRGSGDDDEVGPSS